MRNSVSIWLTDRVLPRRKSWLIAAVLGSLTAILPAASVLAGPYHSYAVELVKKLPAGAQIRPDIETYLDGAASAYRIANGRKGVIADDLMRLAARAQAADMLLAGKSGHISRNGYSFDSRFAAFVDNADRYRARGENAAGDRRKGTPDHDRARRLFQLWLDSSEHRYNLLKRDYEFVSTGVIQRGGELWAVQIFWSRPIAANPLMP